MRRNRKVVESHTLVGFESALEEHKASAAEVSGDALTARMLEAKGDISGAAGEMERKSPLFFGAGANPGLF